jgi:hypothetical protein
VSDKEHREVNPLVGRVDALLRRHHEALRAVDDDVPVLTDVVDAEARARRAVDDAALQALADALERAVLEQLGPELERVIERRLARAMDEALQGARAELAENMRQMVREAVAASVAQALAAQDPGDSSGGKD